MSSPVGDRTWLSFAGGFLVLSGNPGSCWLMPSLHSNRNLVFAKVNRVYSVTCAEVGGIPYKA
jgi:hypothetical protein